MVKPAEGAGFTLNLMNDAWIVGLEERPSATFPTAPD
jgi:hypothetical protein